MAIAEIIGYTYRNRQYCPLHVLDSYYRDRNMGIELVRVDVPRIEKMLDHLASARMIDRYDESHDFPQPITRDSLAEFYCGCSICESGRDCQWRLNWGHCVRCDVEL